MRPITAAWLGALLLADTITATSALRLALLSVGPWFAHE